MKRIIPIGACPPRRNAAKAEGRGPFTLIELLIVITIIAILTSLLLPSLKKSQDLAKRIKCMGNLRQIGNAFNMYCQDYNSYFPSCLDYSQGGSPIWWQSKLAYYISPKATYTHPIYRCPSQADILINYCYAINTCLAYYHKADGTLVRQVPPVQRITKPSRSSILIDGKSGYSNYDYRSRTDPAYTYCSIGFVHGNGANILYVDAHAENHSPITGYGYGPSVIAQSSSTCLYE